MQGKRAVVDDSERLSGTSKAALTIFKAFVATGVLLLPKGTQSAGLVAGTVTLFGCGLLCLISMLMLLSARRNYEEAVANGWMSPDDSHFSAPVGAGVSANTNA
jgi:amino acid permease